MITTTKNLQEKIDQFNSNKKYICTCSYCNSNIIYTKDERRDKINIVRKHDYTIKCPYCGHENTRVIDSRPSDENNSIRRRRACDECSKRFTTYEKIETIPLIVIKKDDNRETYERSKIEGGILRACHKRPVSAQEITNLVDEVETEIFNMEEKEIPSQIIGELVMNKLKDLDAVAYVRFASVYREFKDINTFMDELKKVLQ